MTVAPEFIHAPFPAIAAGATGKVEKLSAAGAVSVKTRTTQIDITSGSNVAFTLADALYEGQTKVLYIGTKGGVGNAVITPTNFQSVTITLDTVNDLIELVFLNGKWRVLSNQGATVA